MYLPNESIYEYPDVANILTPNIRLQTFQRPANDDIYDDRDAALYARLPIDPKAFNDRDHLEAVPDKVGDTYLARLFPPESVRRQLNDQAPRHDFFSLQRV